MKTIKYIPIVIALLLAGCNKYDIKPEQAEGFIKFFTSNLRVNASDVKETADGGYIAVGSLTDENSGMRDIYLIKTDKYGNEESWSPVTIGGDHDDVGTSLQVVSDGYVILGHSKLSDTSEYELYLTKIDLQGNQVWESRRGFLGNVSASNLIVTSSGDFLAAGIRTASGGQQYLLIAQFGMDGTYIRNRMIPPGNSVVNTYLIETQDFYVLCGTELVGGKNEIHIVPYVKASLGQAGGGYLKASGALTGTCIQETTTGNLLICGTMRNTLNGLDEIYLHTKALNSISGGVEDVVGWDNAKTFNVTGGLGSLTGNAVRIVNDNSFAIVGTRTQTGNDDIVLLHCDASGNPVSRIVFGDDGFQQGISLEKTSSDGGLILVGNNGSEDNSMMALVKTDAEGKL